MPFPNAEHAIIEQEKVCDYLLNPGRPVGGPKAVWFASIGYSLDQWRELANDLLQLARTSDDFIATPVPFGVKYEVSGEIGREGHRTAEVVCVWIVDENNLPRLVTAYPG